MSSSKSVLIPHNMYTDTKHIYSREAFADRSQPMRSSAVGQEMKITRRCHLQGKLIWGSLEGLVAGLTSMTRKSSSVREETRLSEDLGELNS
jgi:hypothetical protein